MTGQLDPPGQKPDNQCARCGKPKSSSAGTGSITSYMFQGANCVCSLDGGDADFCPRCGLMLAGASRSGSITSYLFQDIRCKCAPDPKFKPGNMSQQLRQIKEQDGGVSFGRTSGGPETSINLAEGAIIGGAYKINQLIGAGGMGEVYLAEHTGLRKDFALKVIPPDKIDEMGWLRFQQEARVLAKLNHANIVQVNDLSIHEGCLPFCAMEYVRGQNVADLLARSGPLSLSRAIEIFKQVCDGIDYAHRHGIIHRDIKPANIMLTTGDDSPIVKILDFGLARLHQADRSRQSLTAVGEIFGSPFYMSPEQCVGNRIDHRTDFYSLGCTLFECLTGQPPFAGKIAGAIMQRHIKEDPPELSKAALAAGMKALPESMEMIMAKLLRKNPLERYQTAGEIKADLERIERGEAVQPYYSRREKSEASYENDQPTDGRPKWATQRIIAISVTGILTVAIAGSIIFSGKPVQNLPTSKPPSIELKKTNMIDSVASEIIPGFSGPAGASKKTTTPIKYEFDGKPFLRKATQLNGKSLKEYQFPEFTESAAEDSWSAESGLGYFGSPDQTKYLLAGRIKLIGSYKIKYMASDFALNNPKFLGGFSDGDYSYLTLNFPYNYDTSRLSLFPGSFFQMKSLRQVVLRSMHVNQTANKDTFIVALLNQFDSYDNLSMHENISVDACRKIKRLPLLRVFYYEAKEEPINFLEVLANSKTLRTLSLGDCKYTDKTFELIGSIANLDTLSLGYQFSPIKITESQLSQLSHLKRLRSLCLCMLPRGQNNIKALASIKSLRYLNVLADESKDAYDLYMLTRGLPNCKIMTLLKENGIE